ncbi:heterogeneous nuclear ribonucleoprotein L-like isoform X4 [Spodoptera litura]|uniref:Heterogeneous nuclear ribonucleoprotein L-like isoform X4 n=3 Tax=Spodoptera TaxID=7106 RepID=A0A9J7EE27_SPOLT|nr:heterogeneous nuclear ribonucleoprotein L-like isoform X4 [Spodoptera litura]XP_050555908.1 heterogeneous nuclear ribonucleoprotein L isoform X3 [Spodoptera frugiperda]
MAYNGSGGKRLCTGTDLDVERSNGNNYMAGEPRRKREPPARPNHILLYTIINPAYPITVDVIHTISTPHGQVQRIVVFKKNGVQAMVEFESVESATRAKEALHGCDIYSGCCTLKIEFAKPERLNVFKNDQDSWDYTLSEDVPPVQRSAPLLQSPQYTGGRPQPYNMDYGSGGPPPPGMMKDRHGPPPPHHPRERGYGPEGYGGEGFVPPPPMHHPSMPPQNQGGPPQQGAVMMVYGLDPQTVNADRLFNLCCLYGNVVRIKFLKTKEGTAMVQMGDAVSVERCVQNLNNVTVGDYTLTLAFSKQAYLSEVMNPYPLPDKSPSFKDYVGNKNNRFLTPASIHKNRIQPPSKVLHFFNTPPDVSDEQLLQVFKDYGVTPPHTISKFPLKSERSSSGLMEFQNISQSVMAIMACNHATIQHPGAKFPFVMKLCFSSSRQIGQGKGQNPNKSQNQNQDQNNQRQGQNNGLAEHEYY